MMLKGIAAAPGIAMGPAKLLTAQAADVKLTEVAADGVEAEVRRFEEAVAQASLELEQLRTSTLAKLGEAEAEIFETHLFLLQDEEFIGAATLKIRDERMNAEYALKQTESQITAVLESLDDEYLRERAADIRDVSGRLLRKLTGQAEGMGLDGTGAAQVLFAYDLTPSETAQLDPAAVAGFVTEIGGRTSHSAIMARSMDIPAVVGVSGWQAAVRDGQFVIVDGSEGVIHVDPDADTKARYERLSVEMAAKKQLERQFRGLPSVTKDGHRVELAANIGTPKDAAAAKAAGAEGVGLYRTEFLYMDRDDLPSEDEQYEAYRAAVEPFGAEAPVVIRTLDIGGDKKLPYLPLPEEENPFLGVRAIRLCLDRRELFRTQLRAILRAGVHGNVKIMFPMIATLAEWRQAKAELALAMQELHERNVPFSEHLETGIMIEVPAAALMADQFAAEVDFFSIGTNDLVQYTMAADRMNEKLSYLTDPLYPAVLRLISSVIRAASAQGKWVGMCGEMAGQPEALPILLGLGLHEFSMSASAVLPARALLSRMDRAAAVAFADEALKLGSPDEIRAAALQFISKLQD
ncbi:phosphoenolpyruvate--protein phosphotransferase [Paenibacillus gansuensis]|uniref:Phosphoenolpyruvate-protein phosphotransferase n=1 Tax=Paenibacillus gansuensis TaxID=306542 RepID=A0ABW5PJL3_9BACL